MKLIDDCLDAAQLVFTKPDGRTKCDFSNFTFPSKFTAKKTGIDPTKPTSKRVVQKTAEATADLIGNKIADKITSIGKPKEKEKQKTKEIEEIYIPPEKRQQIIDDLRLFWAQNMTPLYKSGISKNYEFSRHSLWW